ncbi:hypothetical protein [Micromonospora sp. DPT]|uniref:hypothetical protein n=1 Tax=Micromonospora sp. DPT TaxID=3142975 RepID=UPI003207CDA2
MSGEADARGRAASIKVGAGFAVMLVVCAISSYLAQPVLAEPVYLARSIVNGGCMAAPGEPARLTGEAVFRRVPPGASPIDEPIELQPCTTTGPGSESQSWGSVTVEYRNGPDRPVGHEPVGLSDEEIRDHYEGAARESGWRLVSDLSERRLVFAMKSLRDRCLWLSVFGRPGYYSLEITFWPKYHDHYCKMFH